MNREGINISCNCYGPLTTPDKYFLTRNRNLEDADHPSSSRRDNKSTQIKVDPDGKTHKKSLKKRPSSFHHAHQNSSSQLSQPLKNQTESKGHITSPEVYQKSKAQFLRNVETPMAAYQHPPAQLPQFNFPETTINVRQPPFSGSHRQFEQPSHAPCPQASQPSYTPTNIYFQKPVSNLRPQLQHFQAQTIINNPRQQIQKQPMIVEENRVVPPLSAKIDERTLIPEAPREYLSNEVSSPGYTSHKGKRGERLVTESWAHNEDDLVIEGFDKLFNKKEENLTQSNFPSSKRNHPRENQKSKRLESQLLMGRFAESDDGDDSDSPPSEVIGRGFDRTYQELIVEEQERGLVSETKASRSTNTKVSEMNNFNRRLSAFTKDNFGNFAQSQFKTYKLL